QDLSGFGRTRGQYREAEILVPVPSASKRDECLAERDWPAVTFLTSRRKAMRWTVVLVAATLLAAASQPSVAQISVDMNRITCGGWLGYSPEVRDFVRFWMSGYYNAAANSNILNYDRFQGNSAKIAAYCKKNKSKTLPTAIKNVGLWQ
ncbi:MAG: HdeA/HdeB family chaperone, partial [Pseudolabrys sp.]